MIGIICKVFIVYGFLLSLGLAMSSQAVALEQNLTASVQVWENINTNLRDRGEMGIHFGQLLPGAVDQDEEGQSESGAVGLEVFPDTNVVLEFSTRANDFASDADVMPIDNVEWAPVNTVDAAVSMSKTPAIIAEVPAGTIQNVWYWLSVPEDQAPGTYGTSFYFTTESIRSDT